jgi:hypothetical protein
MEEMYYLDISKKIPNIDTLLNKMVITYIIINTIIHVNTKDMDKKVREINYGFQMNILRTKTLMMNLITLLILIKEEENKLFNYVFSNSKKIAVNKTTTLLEIFQKKMLGGHRKKTNKRQLEKRRRERSKRNKRKRSEKRKIRKAIIEFEKENEQLLLNEIDKKKNYNRTRREKRKTKALRKKSYERKRREYREYVDKVHSDYHKNKTLKVRRKYNFNRFFLYIFLILTLFEFMNLPNVNGLNTVGKLSVNALKYIVKPLENSLITDLHDNPFREPIKDPFSEKGQHEQSERIKELLKDPYVIEIEKYKKSITDNNEKIKETEKLKLVTQKQLENNRRSRNKLVEELNKKTIKKKINDKQRDIEGKKINDLLIDIEAQELILKDYDNLISTFKSENIDYKAKLTEYNEEYDLLKGNKRYQNIQKYKNNRIIKIFNKQNQLQSNEQQISSLLKEKNKIIEQTNDGIQEGYISLTNKHVKKKEINDIRFKIAELERDNKVLTTEIEGLQSEIINKYEPEMNLIKKGTKKIRERDENELESLFNGPMLEDDLPHHSQHVPKKLEPFKYLPTEFLPSDYLPTKPVNLFRNESNICPMEEFDDFEEFKEPYKQIVEIGRERINPLYFNKEKFNTLVSGFFSITICLVLQIGSSGIFKCKKDDKKDSQSEVNKITTESYFDMNNQTNNIISFINRTLGNETLDLLPTCKAIEEEIRNEEEEDFLPKRNRTSKRRLRGNTKTLKNSPEMDNPLPGNETLPFQSFNTPSSYQGQTSFSSKWMNFGNNNLFSLPKMPKFFQHDEVPIEDIPIETNDTVVEDEIELTPKQQLPMFQWWLESSDNAKDKMYKILIPSGNPSGNVKYKKRSEILNFNSPLQTTEPYPISRMITSMMDFFFGKSSSKHEQMNHIITSLNKKSNSISQNVTTVCETLIQSVHDNDELLQKLKDIFIDKDIEKSFGMSWYKLFYETKDEERIEFMKKVVPSLNRTDVVTFDDITRILQGNYCSKTFQPVLEFKSVFLNQSEYHGHIFYLSNYFKGSLPFHATDIISLTRNSAITVFQELKEITKILIKEVDQLHKKNTKLEPTVMDTEKLLKLQKLKTQIELFRELLFLEDSPNFFYSPVLTFDSSNDNDFFMDGLKTVFNIYDKTSNLIQLINNPLQYFGDQIQKQTYQADLYQNITHNQMIQHMTSETRRTVEFNLIVKSSQEAIDEKKGAESNVWRKWLLYYPKTFSLILFDFGNWFLMECLNFTKVGLLLLGGVGLLGGLMYWMVRHPMQFLGTAVNIFNTGAGFLDFICRNIQWTLRPRLPPPPQVNLIPPAAPIQPPIIQPLADPRQSSSVEEGPQLAQLVNDSDIADASVQVIELPVVIQAVQQVLSQTEQAIQQNDERTVSVNVGSIDAVIHSGGEGGVCISKDDDDMKIGLIITKNKDEDLIQFIQRIKNSEIQRIYTIHDNRLHCFDYQNYDPRLDIIHGSNIKTGHIDEINEDHIVSENILLKLINSIDDNLCEEKLIKLKENTLFDVVNKIDRAINIEDISSVKDSGEWVKSKQTPPTIEEVIIPPIKPITFRPPPPPPKRSDKPPPPPPKRSDKPPPPPPPKRSDKPPPPKRSEEPITFRPPPPPPKLSEQPLSKISEQPLSKISEETLSKISEQPPPKRSDKPPPPPPPKRSPPPLEFPTIKNEPIKRPVHPLASMLSKKTEEDNIPSRPPNPFAASLKEGITGNKTKKEQSNKSLNPMEELQQRMKKKQDESVNISEEEQKIIDKQKTEALDKQIAENARIREEEQKKKKLEGSFNMAMLNMRNAIQGNSNSSSEKSDWDD